MISDKLPPTFVRDWRQLMHNKGYIILVALLYIAAWIIFCSPDWADIHYKAIHMDEPICCPYKDLSERDRDEFHYKHFHHLASEEHVHDEYCYPCRTLCQKMQNLNFSLAFCAMGILALLIPLRIGNSLAADTKVKGTNFLQVTPLSSGRIVGGMWLSAFSQVLLVLLLGLPLLLARAYVMPTGNEADIYGLFYLLLAGSIFSAAYLFISGLNNFLRFGLMALLLISGCALTAFWTDAREAPLLQLPLWLHAANALGAVLITRMFLHLARRGYAAPAENCTFSVRLDSLLCMLLSICVAVVILWNSEPLTYYGWDLAGGDGLLRGRAASLEMVTIVVLMLAAVFGALADAILPVVKLPVHSVRCHRFLPKFLQMPGMVSSCLFLLIPLLGFSTFCCVLAEGGDGYERLLRAYEFSGHLYNLPLCCIAGAFVLWVAVALGILVGDFFCRRSKPLRPLVIIVSCAGLGIITALVAAMLDYHAHRYDEWPWVPILNIPAPFEAADALVRAFSGYGATKCEGELPDLAVTSEWILNYDPLAKHEANSILTFSVSAAEAVIVFILLALRARKNRNDH